MGKTKEKAKPKTAIDWMNDQRENAENLAPIESWDAFASKVEPTINATEQSPMIPFCANASAIYGKLIDQNKEAQKSVVLIQRQQRLKQLFDMWESSNWFDFYLIKYPAWRLNEWIERRKEKQERKMNHV